MNSIFQLDNEQFRKANYFVQIHDHSSRFSIEFILPNGFGIMQMLKCLQCGETISLTNWESF